MMDVYFMNKEMVDNYFNIILSWKIYKKWAEILK